ncbi:MAG: ABC transporter ATP-binding protein [Oscillospiraceae bacterium]|nr:ABC transporter ATP-binding protein [Oscillospiraceae bacterium]
MDTVVEFTNVTKTYKLYKNDKRRLIGIFSGSRNVKRKTAIDNVSFVINRGESVAVLGKNGAGKSTLLKMITGVCFPTSGNVAVCGIVSALLELSTGFDKEFTGRENIYLKGRLMGLKDKEIKSLEKDIVNFAEIEEYIDQPVRTYSSGMKARLGFSISVNIKPEILIVDEALSVGDEEFKNKCLDKVNEIMKSGEVTLIFVTHSTVIAKQFCSRGIVLAKGQVKFDGEIDKAIERYNKSIKNKKRSAAKTNAGALS